MATFIDTGNAPVTPGGRWNPDSPSNSPTQVPNTPIADLYPCPTDDSGGMFFKTLQVNPGETCSPDNLVILPFPCISVTRAATSGAVGSSAWMSFTKVGKTVSYVDANEVGDENWIQINGLFRRWCKPFRQCYITIVGGAGPNPNPVTIAFSKYLDFTGFGS